MEQRKGGRADEILDAFMVLAGRYTADKTTMRDVARHLGVSVGVIYQEFAGKRELLAGLVGRVADGLFDRVEAELGTCTTAAEQLHVLTITFCRMQIEALDAHPSIAEMLIRDGVSVRYVRTDFSAVRDRLARRHQARITAVLKAGMRCGEFASGNAAGLARIISRAFAGFPFEAVTSGDRRTFDRDMMAMFQLILRGITNVRE